MRPAFNEVPDNAQSGTVAGGPRRHLSVVPAERLDEDAGFRPRMRWRRRARATLAALALVGIAVTFTLAWDRTEEPASDQHQERTGAREPLTQAQDTPTQPEAPVTGVETSRERVGELPTVTSPELPAAETRSPTMSTSPAPVPSDQPSEATSEASVDAEPEPVQSQPHESSGPAPLPAPQQQATAEGHVSGCNTYGFNCDANPLYAVVPQGDYDWTTWPKAGTVPNGTILTARCWSRGGVTYNYSVKSDPPDYGPDPYESDIYFNVLSHDGRWAWIPDTYFVRDKTNRMGLPEC